MKLKHTVKRHFAVLMTAILLATSLPLTALATIERGGGPNDTWNIASYAITDSRAVFNGKPEPVLVGTSVDLTIIGNLSLRTATSSNVWIGPSWLDHVDPSAAIEAMNKIDVDDFIILFNGEEDTQHYVSISDIGPAQYSDGELRRSLSVTCKAAGTVKIILEADDYSLSREIVFANKSKVIDLKKVDNIDNISVSVDARAVIHFEPVFDQLYDGRYTMWDTQDYQDFSNNLQITLDNPDLILDDTYIYYSTIHIIGNPDHVGETTTLTITYPGCDTALTYKITIEGKVEGGDLYYEYTSEAYDSMAEKLGLSWNWEDENEVPLLEQLRYITDPIDVYGNDYFTNGNITPGFELAENKAILNAIGEKYSEYIKEGLTIFAYSEVSITDLDVVLQGDKIVVTGMTIEFFIKVRVPDKQMEDYREYSNYTFDLSGTGLNYRMLLGVAMPSVRSGNYVKWSHYDSEADLNAKKSNNEGIKDSVTEIFKTGYEGMPKKDYYYPMYAAYVDTPMDGIFTLEFVTEDNSSGSSEGSGSGSSGSGSSGGSSSGSSSGGSSGGSWRPSSGSSSKTEQQALPKGMPEYVVAGSWTQEGESWKFADADGNAYVSKWAAVYNPYAHTDQGQSNFDWFMFDADGNMVTGWYLDTDGNYYYLNPVSDGTKGKMMTGWIQDGGEWYYLSPVSDGARGHMVTGWLQDGDKWYYLSPVSDGKKGHMLTGWQQIDGVWYYLDLTDGHMLANTTTPDGYVVDANGARMQ